VICFINPNNPTGSLLRSSWIFGLARRYADKTFFVDESFIDFSGEPSLLGSLAQEPLPNVVVLKSLGKSLGVPGLRLGCAYSSNLDFIRRLRAVLPIWNLNALAENYLEIILKHQGEIAASYELNRQERDFLRTELARLSFVEKVSDSQGNFLLARFRCEPGQMETKLKTLVTERGIYVKDCTEKFGGQAALARVGVRRREDNERLLEGLRHIFSTR
jgi:histidinol-phosphate/aromatic aminotransferase/cobyric acid decarboxylase-like protein